MYSLTPKAGQSAESMLLKTFYKVGVAMSLIGLKYPLSIFPYYLKVDEFGWLPRPTLYSAYVKMYNPLDKYVRSIKFYNQDAGIGVKSHLRIISTILGYIAKMVYFEYLCTYILYHNCKVHVILFIYNI